MVAALLRFYTVPKKEATKLLAITFSNLNLFSKFFHCWIEDEYFQQNGGKYYAVLLEIFILYSAVNEFWKSFKIWESYCQKFGGFLFLEHSVVDIDGKLDSGHIL